jgi:hypothetical protein
MQRVMHQDEYLSQRVDEQIAWYSQKSRWNQVMYKRLRGVEIVCAAAIPLLVGMVDDQVPWLKLAAGVLGVAVAVIAGLLALYKFQENWLQYRSTAESLKQEKFLFLTAAGPYAEDQSFALLVQRVEYLLSRENRSWAQYMQEPAEQSTAGQARRGA